MKKKLLIILLVLTPILFYAQGNAGTVVSQINSWKNSLTIIVKAFIGMAAIGGGVWVYLKMQSDDGGSGKKALLNYIGALLFAALMWILIDFFIA